MTEPLVVAIEAQVPSGQEGGIEPLLIALLGTLGQLRDGAEEYRIVTNTNDFAWLEPYLASNQKIVPAPAPAVLSAERVKRFLGPLRAPAGKMLRRAKRAFVPPSPPTVPATPHSDGFYESLGAHVLHITYPLHFFLSALPTVFGIYDLNHRHLDTISAEHTAWREVLYSDAFAHSRVIAADAYWVRDDVIKQYNTPREKLFAVPLAAPMAFLPEPTVAQCAQVQVRYKLPAQFVLYPSRLYQHKNHLRLLDALALLRDRDNLRVPCVCTGPTGETWDAVRAHRATLQLQEQVLFLDFVPGPDLKAIFHLARGLVFPSIFEGIGLGAVDAMNENLAIACSDIVSLREYVGDGAIYFDPHSVDDMSQAIRRLWSDDALRQDLIARGRAQNQKFSWLHTAKTYRALYRHAAGRALTPEDQWLLRVAQTSSDEKDD